MKLHEYKDEFVSLISIVAHKLHIAESAVKRDFNEALRTFYEINKIFNAIDE